MDETNEDEDTRRLRRELRRLGQAPVPAGLLRRLLAIPSGREPAWRWLLAPAVPAAVAAIAIVLVARQPLPEEDPGVAALQDFRVAMSYVRRGATVTNEEISNALQTGLREAYGISRVSVLGDAGRPQQGDQDED
jgi:hypothetical protein